MLVKVGELYETKNCGKCRVIDYLSAGEIRVKFLQTKTKVWCQAGHLRKGTVKDPNYPNVQGVGFLGIGEFATSYKRKHTKEYDTWHSMLTRAYSPKYQAKYPTYVGVTVCKEWHNFQNFAEWYNKQPHSHLDGYELDKDLLVPGSKVYSPKTCALVPKDINLLLRRAEDGKRKWPTGVYFHKQSGKFHAEVGLSKGIGRYLGNFDTLEEAHAAYCEAKTIMVRSIAKEYRSSLDARVYKVLRKYTEVRG